MTSLISKERYLWLDIVRGLAIMWIFLVHFIERFIKCSIFSNPISNWPPLDVDGLSGVAINLLCYVGCLGDQGVQIFLVASGFGLTMSSLNSGADFSIQRFFSKRIVNIIPLWVAVHILFMAAYILFGKGLPVTDWRTWTSLFGLRFLPEVMYFKFPAWWYIGVLLQLYAVFPWLFFILRRWSPLKYLIIVGGGAVLIRLAGLYLFEQPLTWWSDGAIFVARLPEFAFGMAFAKWLHTTIPEKTARLKSPIGFIGILALYLLGNICTFTLAGMSVAFLFTGAAFFILIWMLFEQREARWTYPLAWTGRRSYGVYLFHHPVIIFLVPASLVVGATGRIVLYFLITATISIIGAVILNGFINFIIATHRRWKQNSGFNIALIRWASIVGVFIGLTISAEAVVRLVDPQEVLGWGERPSLEPHDTYGYRLKPNTTTRLRWQSYNYIVEANALGFPGKLYEKDKPDHVYRIMVTGDAFESAEGVDTKDAWPRLLEKQLTQERGIEAQVLNFSITGWGPGQYAAVIADYAPEYKPDLIIVGFFVNDLFSGELDVNRSQRSVGFQKISQTSIQAYLSLSHLRSWIKGNLFFPLREFIKNKPNPAGYFFGYLRALEKDKLHLMTDNVDFVEDRLMQIRNTARELESKLLVVLVPCSYQVSGPDTLKYYPNGIDFQDTSRFDLDQPQRLSVQLCNKLSIPYTDLRDPLQKVADKTPYQPRNMHWTKVGHEVVARYLKTHLLENRYLNSQKTDNSAHQISSSNESQ